MAFKQMSWLFFNERRNTMGYYDFNLEKVSDLDLQNKVKKYERYNEPCSYLWWQWQPLS